MFYVYLLQSDNDNRYIGFTNDLKRRIKEHFSGQSQHTKKYLPMKHIFYEAYINEEDARRRERYLKTTQGRRALKRMLRCHDLAKPSRKQGSTT